MTRGKGCKNGMKPEVEKREGFILFGQNKGCSLYSPTSFFFFFSVSCSLGYYFAPCVNLADV